MVVSREHAALIIVLLLLLLAACGGQDATSTAPASAGQATGGTATSPESATLSAIDEDTPPPIEDIYAGLAATLQRDGMVLHSIWMTETEIMGFGYSEVTYELWADGVIAVSRMELTGVFEYDDSGERRGHTESIVTGDGRYRTALPGDDDGFSVVEAEGCHGQPEAIAQIIGCPGPTETSTTSVEWSEYKGQTVLVLVTEGEFHGSDETTRFTQRTYLDSETFLPLASETEGTFSMGESHALTAEANYEHEFIERATLPEDFFDPKSIGYVPPDLTGWLDKNIETPLYWLGERFDPGGGLPALVLSAANEHAGFSEQLPDYEALLVYTPADYPHGPSAVTIQVWTVTEWEARVAQAAESGMTDRLCVETEQIPIEGGEAMLQQWQEGEWQEALAPSLPTPDAPAPPPAVTPEPCKASGPERFTAIVRFPETVLTLDTPGGTGPYNSREAMLALIEGLERR